MTGIAGTGLNGFIGKHLVKRLGRYTAIPHEDIQLPPLDVAIEGLQYFYFLSAYGNMSSHQENDLIVRANLLDLAHVLSKIDWSKNPVFVYVSTSSVKLEHQTMYSRTKRAAEELLLAYMEMYDACIIIVRPMSVTGVGEQKEYLIPKLIDSCINETPMPFVGEPVHDFIDVEDFVDGVMTLVENRAKGIYEIGRGRAYSNWEVLKTVEKVIGKKVILNIVDSMRPYDNTKWVSMNKKIREYGWKPKKTLTKTIKQMYESRLRKKS